MADTDYKAILTKELKDLESRLRIRRELDVDIASKYQFICATINMLDDADKAGFEKLLNELSGESLGLTDAIRKVLSEQPRKWHTATAVKNKLQETGFDFSNYRTSPLASVHAILKRLKPTEVETSDIEGVMAWRWKSHDRVIKRYRVAVIKPSPVKPLPLSQLIAAPAPVSTPEQYAGFKKKP